MEKKRNLRNILLCIALCVLILLAAILGVLVAGVYGSKTAVYTQIATMMFASAAPFAVLISLIALVIGGLVLCFSDKKKIRILAIVMLGCSISANLITVPAMVKWNHVVKENGGSYSFFKSVFQVSFCGSDTPDEQIVYREADGENLKISVYKPEEEKEKLPVYVYIHGGGWTNNNSETMSGLHRAFAKDGFVAFSVNYRLGTEENPTWNKAIEDCAYALKWVYENAEQYGGDKENIIVMGESAGGNLALIYSDASASGKLKELYGIEVPVPSATCVMYPVVDVRAYATEGLFLTAETPKGFDTPYLGGTVDEYPDRLAFVSPINYITEKDPPTLIIHGEKDSLVTVDGSRSYVEKSTEAGADAALVVLPYCNHASELLTNNMTHQADQTIIINFLKEKGIVK